VELDYYQKNSVKSAYEQLNKGDFGISYRRVWRAKVPENKKFHVVVGVESYLNKG
jgi:hypothetical protein